MIKRFLSILNNKDTLIKLALIMAIVFMLTETYISIKKYNKPKEKQTYKHSYRRDGRRVRRGHR